MQVCRGQPESSKSSVFQKSAESWQKPLWTLTSYKYFPEGWTQTTILLYSHWLEIAEHLDRTPAGELNSLRCPKVWICVVKKIPKQQNIKMPFEINTMTHKLHIKAKRSQEKDLKIWSNFLAEMKLPLFLKLTQQMCGWKTTEKDVRFSMSLCLAQVMTLRNIPLH